MFATRRSPRSAALAATLAFVALVGPLAACAGGDGVTGTNDQEQTHTTPPPDNAAGIVTGTVVDTRGQPLAGVKVIADNTLFYNTNVIGYTDARGHYKLDVSGVVGTWHMTAHLAREFNGQTFDLYLHPNSDAPFAGTERAVRNFEWRLTGPRADGLGSYGGNIQFIIDQQGWATNAHQTDVEFTLTPVGPLIDGSAGKTLTVRANYDWYTVRDLPIGQYKITARYAPDGQAPRPMVLRWYGQGNYVDTLTPTWPGVGYGGVLGFLDLQVTAPQN